MEELCLMINLFDLLRHGFFLVPVYNLTNGVTSCPYLPVTLPHVFEFFKYKWKDNEPHKQLYPQKSMDCRQESIKQLQQSGIQHLCFVFVIYGEFMGYKVCSVCFRLFFLCLDFRRKGSNKTKLDLACCEQLRMNSL